MRRIRRATTDPSHYAPAPHLRFDARSLPEQSSIRMEVAELRKNRGNLCSESSGSWHLLRSCLRACQRLRKLQLTSGIRELATRWEQAWNQHDMKQLVSLMTEDADFVNVGARHWKGRPEIEAEHTQRLNQFRESTWSTKAVTVQFLKPDAALVHVDWALKGDTDPDGTPRSPRSRVRSSARAFSLL
jgi:uncharacterized protein (TIGR02246 family)